MATSFESRLGLTQGRIAPSASVPADGDYVFVLGDDLAGVVADLAIGDDAEISQSLDLTTLDVVRFKSLTIREPSDALASGLRWDVSVLVDSVAEKTVRGRSGRSHTFTDLAVDVHHLSGVHVVGVRLALVAA